MDTNQPTTRGGRAAIAVLIAAAMAVLLAAMSFAPEASAEEREPEYSVSYYAFDCADYGDTGVYAGFDSERDGRPVEVCTKPGHEPVKYESQCLFGGLWRADLGGGTCLFRKTRPPVCLAPHVMDENGTCWFQLLTDLHLDPVVDPGDETEPPPVDEDETEPPVDTTNDDDEADTEDEGDDEEERGARSVPRTPVCIESDVVQGDPAATLLSVGDVFPGPGESEYVIVSGDQNNCSFACLDGWDTNCDGRIGDFCPAEYNRSTVFGVWQCLRHMTPSAG